MESINNQEDAVSSSNNTALHLARIMQLLEYTGTEEDFKRLLDEILEQVYAPAGIPAGKKDFVAEAVKQRKEGVIDVHAMKQLAKNLNLNTTKSAQLVYETVTRSADAQSILVILSKLLAATANQNLETASDSDSEEEELTRCSECRGIVSENNCNCPYKSRLSPYIIDYTKFPLDVPPEAWRKEQLNGIMLPYDWELRAYEAIRRVCDDEALERIIDLALKEQAYRAERKKEYEAAEAAREAAIARRRQENMWKKAPKTPPRY